MTGSHQNEVVSDLGSTQVRALYASNPMKILAQITLAAFVGLFLTGVGYGGIQPLVFYPSSVDLGHFWDCDTTNLFVVVSNAVQEDISILEATAGCRCTKPVLSDIEVKAGQVSTLKVEFSPRHQEGAMQRKVTLLTQRGPFEWTLAARVQRKILTSTNALQFDLEDGQSVKTNILVNYLGEESWQPDNLRLIPGLEATAVKLTKNKFELQLTVYPSAMTTFDWQEQYLTIAGRASPADAVIRVDGKRRRLLMISPETLNLGSVPRNGALTSARVTVQHKTLRQDFQIFSVNSAQPWLECASRKIAPGVYEITAMIRRYPGTLPPTLFDFPIEVTSNDPKNRLFTVNAIGIASDL